MLVVIEGIDGCGKETQMRLLSNFPQFKYPTKNNSRINEYLTKKINIDPKSLFLLFLSDILEEQGKIMEEINQNKIVFLDRYVFSTIAYETGVLGKDNAKKIVSSLNFLIPDKIIYLDILPEEAQKRKKNQKILDRYEENLVYQKSVRGNFLKLYEERYLTSNWHKIDASMSIEEVHREIAKIVGIAPLV